MTGVYPARPPIASDHTLVHDPEYPLTTAPPLPPPPVLAPFNPDEHLCFESPKTSHTLESLKFTENVTSTAPSQVGITEPFPLFTSSAVKSLRHELFQPQLLKDCAWYPNPETCQLRGMAPKYVKFMYDAWMHPSTLAAVSAAAGTELEIIMPYEIGHTNIQMGPEGKGDVFNIPFSAESSTPLKLSESMEDDDLARPTVHWHYDSYPFVCIVSLSTRSATQKGGETALRRQDGSVLKVAAPGEGWAVVLQGGLIEHVALRAFGYGERITMVTSFRPVDPNVYDLSVLTTVRPISKLAELYVQWFRYRSEVLKKRCEERAIGATEGAEVMEMKKWCEEQIWWLRRTMEEMVIYDTTT
jgi:hypothetical protein